MDKNQQPSNSQPQNVNETKMQQPLQNQQTQQNQNQQFYNQPVMQNQPKQPEQFKQQLNQQAPQKKQKKKGGCFSFFMGWCAAFFFLIFCIGGFGAYVYFCVTFEQLAGVFGAKAPLGDFNNKTVNELIKIAIAEKDEYLNITFDKLNSYGIELPSEFMGVNLGDLYNADITFDGTTQKLGSVKIMDAINNIEPFMESVLPAIYETAVVGDVLNALQIDISEIGYPATTDAIYDVDGTNKKLTELTIAEALIALPNYYGEENLTLAKLQVALNLSLIPNTAEYQTLLSKTIPEITFEDLANSMSIGSVLDLLGENALALDSFAFTQTDEFRNTKINDVGNYIKTVPLNQILTIEDITTIENPTSTQRLMYSIRNVTVEELMQGGKSNFGTIMDKVKLNDLLNTTSDNNVIMEILGSNSIADLLFSPDNISKALLLKTDSIDTILQGVSSSSNPYLYAVKEYTFKELYDNVSTSEIETALNNIKFSEIIKTDQNIIFPIKNVSLYDVLFNPTVISTTLTEYSGAMQTVLNLTDPNELETPTELQTNLWTIKDETFNSLKNAYNTLNEGLKEITISNLTGSSSGIMAVIGSVSLGEILSDTNCITNVLNSSNVTLGEMLSLSSAEKGLVSIIKNISVGNLFSNAGTAISNALKNSTSTLASLLEIETPSGVVATITDITVGALFTNPAEALEAKINNIKLEDVINTEDNKILTAIVNQKNNPEFTSEFGTDVTVKNLGNAINFVTLKDILDDTTTGIISLFDTNTKLKDINTTFQNFDLMDKTILSLETAGIFGDSSPFKNSIYDVDSKILVDGTNNAYQKYVIDNDGNEPNEKLSDFINSLTTTTEGVTFLQKFLNGTLTPTA